MRSASPRASGRPSPKPGRTRPASPRSKRRKTRSRSPAASPGPSSATRSTASSPSRAPAMRTPPGAAYVLEPARGVVRGAGGHVAGRFEVALQDDLGFVRLVRRFTGARVSLSTAAGHVPVSPPPTAGAGYRAASFTATAFPSGALRVVLAVPSGSQSGG